MKDAYDAAMATCQATMGNCKPLTYGCVNPTLEKAPQIKGVSGHLSPSMANKIKIE